MLKRASTDPQPGPGSGLGERRMAAQSRSLAPWPRVSVVIPTLNEARNLPHVFGALPSDIYEIIVVDGHSVDDTLAVVRELRPDARIVMQTRSGKGNALACGCATATGDIIAMIDADGSTDAGRSRASCQLFSTELISPRERDSPTVEAVRTSLACAASAIAC